MPPQNRQVLIAKGWAFIVCVFALSARNGTLAGPPMPFTEEAAARGINYTLTLPGFARGVAFADLDLDHDPDVVLMGQSDKRIGVFENDGTGHFTDHSLTSGIPLLTDPSGVVALDYDADGDLDLFITQTEMPNVLLRNDGGFTFTDVSIPAQVADAALAEGPAVGDYNNDGLPDIYVPNYGTANRLYRNMGDGTFVDVAPLLGVDDPWRGFQAAFFDADRDGDADLYISNDKRLASETVMHNILYENTGGTFVDRSATSGTDANIYSMGLAVGDFDGNLFQDLYCTNVPVEPNVLFLNQDQFSFVSAAVTAGVESFRLGWGALFFDYDNDTHMDLYVCNEGIENRLYDYDGSWPAVDLATELAVDNPGGTLCLASADIDNDGDLDILMPEQGQAARLYINHEGEARNWVKFRIIGQPPNHFAVGARVDVHFDTPLQSHQTGTLGGSRSSNDSARGNVPEAVTVWRTREVIAGSNFKSQNELTQHFGVGTASILHEVVVTWPSGTTTRTLTNVPVNQTLPVYPPERLGDSDGNGVVDLSDVDDFVAVLLGSDTDPDHVALSDMNGDSSADGGDLSAFVQQLLP
ncbi:MAG: CRTAC1 family protein [Phycisphaerae bacterium]